MAAWTNQGISKGNNDAKKDADKDEDEDKDKDKDKKDTKKGCDNFGYGDPAKCKLSQAAVVFGVLIW